MIGLGIDVIHQRKSQYVQKEMTQKHFDYTPGYELDILPGQKASTHSRLRKLHLRVLEKVLDKRAGAIGCVVRVDVKSQRNNSVTICQVSKDYMAHTHASGLGGLRLTFPGTWRLPDNYFCRLELDSSQPIRRGRRPRSRSPGSVASSAGQ
jgi:hypothetical protein